MLPTSAAPKQSLAQVYTKQGDCVCTDECGPCACNDFGLGQDDTKYDWRDATANRLSLRAVNEIVDQSTCSASWAFAATAQEETQDFITNAWHGLQKYSEQMLIDCNPWRYGCTQDGNIVNVFSKWMIPAGVKQILDSKYPYINGQKSVCNSSGAVQEDA